MKNDVTLKLEFSYDGLMKNGAHILLNKKRLEQKYIHAEIEFLEKATQIIEIERIEFEAKWAEITNGFDANTLPKKLRDMVLDEFLNETYNKLICDPMSDKRYVYYLVGRQTLVMEDRFRGIKVTGELVD